MTLYKDTYAQFDRAKKVIPDLEFRFINDRCYLYVNGTSRYWCSGRDDHINNIMEGICFGIALAGHTVPSLKKTLNSL